MRCGVKRVALVGLLCVAVPAFARAQSSAPATPPAPPAKPAPLSGSVSFGLGLTSGNKDTTTFNGSYDLKYDPKTRNVVKSSGLFLYARTDGELSIEQYAMTVRDEYSLDTRAFVFGEVRYLHDKFKGMSYLLAPTVGGGYKVVDGKDMTLALSAGAGTVSEKDYGFDARTTGAVSFEEKFSRTLSASATVGQSVSALWDMTALGDALYLFGVNVTATLVGKAQLKVEALDTYKTRPPDPTFRRNDVALLTGIVVKF
jgi:putative salt-induced outer membrane protein